MWTLKELFRIFAGTPEGKPTRLRVRPDARAEDDDVNCDSGGEGKGERETPVGVLQFEGPTPQNR